MLCGPEFSPAIISGQPSFSGTTPQGSYHHTATRDTNRQAPSSNEVRHLDFSNVPVHTERTFTNNY